MSVINVMPVTGRSAGVLSDDDRATLLRLLDRPDEAAQNLTSRRDARQPQLA